jgi:oxalate decarboxylase/phosphoglucose isomerase-like protein (cupin superfamily)
VFVSGVTARIVRESEARSFLEGLEHCREYLREPRMWFGTSTLLPGQQGAIDPGHPTSVEVFYCCSGHVLVDDGQQCYELRGGDALVIPEGLPHAITNVGEISAVIAWAGAPGE